MSLKKNFTAVAMAVTAFAVQAQGFYFNQADLYRGLLVGPDKTRDDRAFYASKCLAAAVMLKTEVPNENSETSLAGQVSRLATEKSLAYYADSKLQMRMHRMIIDNWAPVLVNQKFFDPEGYKAAMKSFREYISACSINLSNLPDPKANGLENQKHPLEIFVENEGKDNQNKSGALWCVTTAKFLLKEFERRTDFVKALKSKKIVERSISVGNESYGSSLVFNQKASYVLDELTKRSKEIKALGAEKFQYLLAVQDNTISQCDEWLPPFVK